jgi:hypothetical protein
MILNIIGSIIGIGGTIFWIGLLAFIVIAGIVLIIQWLIHHGGE